MTEIAEKSLAAQINDRVQEAEGNFLVVGGLIGVAATIGTFFYEYHALIDHTKGIIFDHQDDLRAAQDNLRGATKAQEIIAESHPKDVESNASAATEVKQARQSLHAVVGEKPPSLLIAQGETVGITVATAGLALGVLIAANLVRRPFRKSKITKEILRKNADIQPAEAEPKSPPPLPPPPLPPRKAA